jgi:hypothetical protein
MQHDLPVPSGEVVEGDIAEDVVESPVLRDGPPGAADDDAQLGLLV